MVVIQAWVRKALKYFLLVEKSKSSVRKQKLKSYAVRTNLSVKL
jgi:hypothetical protein